MHILALDHAVLRANDLAAMTDFYTRVLGLGLDREVPELGLVHLRAGRSMLDLISVSGKLGAPGGAAPGSEGRNLDHLCLRIEPFDEAALRARFAAHGVALSEVHDNYGAEGRGPSVYLQDPEGNVVELKGPSGA
ncbi:lactoylglutathione lyase [Geothrix rubra]|uniref:Lactoylglutathione lyase n=1 Tax=Geothrix rubra TaxID=2927977 RepID=A0ABQ5Q9X5_9BACT|nr:VOC family protein [Geothrix rubra]GLH71359.1 lactoylglutathione lyase [Geothrix rubra]